VHGIFLSLSGCGKSLCNNFFTLEKDFDNKKSFSHVSHCIFFSAVWAVQEYFLFGNIFCFPACESQVNPCHEIYCWPF